MLAVQLTGRGVAEIAERPRPVPVEPGDAIVAVTTAAIGPWDLAPEAGAPRTRIPGAEFAGTVVETGSAVTRFRVDDLVIAAGAVPADRGTINRFGGPNIDGGHAEYVRVPNADQILVATSASSEERTVLAGGTLALGADAAELALQHQRDGRIALLGCDPVGICALAWLRRRGFSGPVTVSDLSESRLALAERYGGSQVDTHGGEALPDVVIVGAEARFIALPEAVRPGSTAILTYPDDGGDAGPAVGNVVRAGWPSRNRLEELAMAVHLKLVDLTPLVSHTLPLDQAATGYGIANGAGQGVNKVLLKP